MKLAIPSLFWGGFFVCIFLIFFFVYLHTKKTLTYEVSKIDEIPHLFPHSAADVHRFVKTIKQRAEKDLKEFLSIPAHKRTFENTSVFYDRLSFFYFGVPAAAIHAIAMTTSDDALRAAAHDAQVELSHLAIDLFGQNIDVYNAFKEYIEGPATKETLTQDQEYYLQELMHGFKDSGLHLPEEQRKKVTALLKELAELTTLFQKNINSDTRFLTVTKEQLSGMDDHFLAQLEKAGDDLYKITTDYPIYFPILEYCTVEQTRHDIYRLFTQRAYPQNIEILNKIIALRDELARIIGYNSYAALSISDSMAKTPERVRTFLDGLVKRVQQKADQEIAELKKDLPASVTLVNGKFKPWDLSFARQYYKKKHFNLDERELADYFPMEKTLEALLSIYEQFFDIRFKKEPISGLWDKEIQLVCVYSKNDAQPIGYLLLDLFPRQHKYGHACQMTVVPALMTHEKRIPGVVLIIANFPKSTKETPSLLQLKEVTTFFHEFGHALHALFGVTKMAAFSGTHVKKDFVEMPSQMLEKWLQNADILKMVSHNYETGQPLSQNLIDTVLNLKDFAIGDHILRQLVYAFLSLDYFEAGAQKDVLELLKNVYQRIIPYIQFDPENKFPASFGHLMGYGPSYYGYLWSEVFAVDLFYHIKKFGLLNPAIGTHYEQVILKPGGSKDPDILLKEFLGREPNDKAFFKDLNL